MEVKQKESERDSSDEKRFPVDPCDEYREEETEKGS